MGLYYGDDRDDPTKNGGQYGSGVTIIGYPTPPPPYPTPGFNTGGSNNGGGGGTGGSSSDTGTYTNGNPLHPEMVNHLMTSTFKFDPKLLSPDEKAAFEKVLQAIDSTQAGDKMLTALDNYYKNNPNAIKPSITHNAPAPGAEGTFRTANQEYDFGTLLSDNSTLVSWKLDTVAHEMYHNFQYINPGQYANNVNREVDANLFAALVEKQSGLLNASAMETRIEAQSPTTQAQKDFNAAWEKFVNNGDVSQDNYNKIVDNFFSGSRTGSQYQFTAPINTNEPQFLKDLTPPSYPPRYK